MMFRTKSDSTTTRRERDRDGDKDGDRDGDKFRQRLGTDRLT